MFLMKSKKMQTTIKTDFDINSILNETNLKDTNYN